MDHIEEMTGEVYLRFDCRAHGRDADFEHSIRGAEHIVGSYGGCARGLLRSGPKPLIILKENILKLKLLSDHKVLAYGTSTLDCEARHP